MDAQFVFMAESRWQMSDVANTWNGHHPVPYSVLPPHSVHTQAHTGKGTASNPMSWYITYEPSAAQTFCKYFVKLGRNKKYLSLGSAHYTPNFYISFVIELSWPMSNVQCPDGRAWILKQLDWILVTPHAEETLCLAIYHCEPRRRAASLFQCDPLWYFHLCFASLDGTLYRFFLISLFYSLFAKGLSLTNDFDLRRNKDLSILITAERGLIVRK